MQIHAFVPAGQVELVDGSVNANRVPMVNYHLPPLMGDQAAHQVQAELLLAISAPNDGTETDPHFYIKVHDGDGELRLRAQQMFIWNDEPTGSPIKWRVFDLHLPVLVINEGLYQFGVYATDDDEPHQALSSFVLPIILDAPGQLPAYLPPPPVPNN